MTDNELIAIITMAHLQAVNGFYMSNNDIKNFEYAMEVLNNELKQFKYLQESGRLEN